MTTRNELSTAEWLRTFEQARSIGCVQLGLSGGEPLMRPDLIDIVSATRKMGYYVNLITSAVGLNNKKIDQLKTAGLDSVQISFQAEQRQLNDFIAGKPVHEHKLRMMHAVRQAGLPLTLNLVIHRLNIDRIKEICALCDSMNPDYVELASVQAHGWALKNANVLMPTPEQVTRAQKHIDEYQRLRTSGIFYVLPDLLEGRAKACHQGWGKQYMCVNPQGDVAPCLSAHTITDVRECMPNVRHASMREIWEQSDAFNMFRGTDWMLDASERQHERRRTDFGGCRCQAAAHTGDARYMDPACETSVHHESFRHTVKRMYETPTDLSALMPRKIQSTSSESRRR